MNEDKLNDLRGKILQMPGEYQRAIIEAVAESLNGETVPKDVKYFGFLALILDSQLFDLKRRFDEMEAEMERLRRKTQSRGVFPRFFRMIRGMK